MPSKCRPTRKTKYLSEISKAVWFAKKRALPNQWRRSGHSAETQVLPRWWIPLWRVLCRTCRTQLGSWRKTLLDQSCTERGPAEKLLSFTLAIYGDKTKEMPLSGKSLLAVRRKGWWRLSPIGGIASNYLRLRDLVVPSPQRSRFAPTFMHTQTHRLPSLLTQTVEERRVTKSKWPSGGLENFVLFHNLHRIPFVNKPLDTDKRDEMPQNYRGVPPSQ